jgi:hypothetical protein
VLSLLGLFVLPVLVSGCLADGRGGVPWFGARPQIISRPPRPGVDAMIEKIRAAVAHYPYATQTAISCSRSVSE